MLTANRSADRLRNEGRQTRGRGNGNHQEERKGTVRCRIPLICGERILGVIEGVREGSGARAFKKPDVALLDSLSLPIASALANAVRIAEAERLSQTDDLTKLHNAVTCVSFC
jgi:hypothetical protein